MKRGHLLFALVCLSPCALRAENLSSDHRFQSMRWQGDGLTLLQMAIGNSLTIIFDPGETITAVNVDNKSALRVALAPLGDSMTLDMTLPVAQNELIVQTILRKYRFNVVLSAPQDATYAVRMDGASEINVSSKPNLGFKTSKATYVMKGDVSQRPSRIEDDGERTYLYWSAEQDMPATFSLNRKGEEETVDSYVRGGVQVIDRVYSGLVFKSGKSKAWARRRALPAQTDAAR
jgi:type IV secretory pathway VirB9-like protein